MTHTIVCRVPLSFEEIARFAWVSQSACQICAQNLNRNRRKHAEDSRTRTQNEGSAGKKSTISSYVRAARGKFRTAWIHRGHTAADWLAPNSPRSHECRMTHSRTQAQRPRAPCINRWRESCGMFDVSALSLLLRPTDRPYESTSNALASVKTEKWPLLLVRRFAVARN